MAKGKDYTVLGFRRDRIGRYGLSHLRNEANIAREEMGSILLAYFFGPPDIAGTGTGVDAADGSAGNGIETFAGGGAGVDAGDASSGTGAQVFAGTGSGTEAADSSQGDGVQIFSGTGEGTENGDASNGGMTVTSDTIGAGNGTEPGDSSNGQGTGGTIHEDAAAGIGEFVRDFRLLSGGIVDRVTGRNKRKPDRRAVPGSHSGTAEGEEPSDIGSGNAAVVAPIVGTGRATDPQDRSGGRAEQDTEPIVEEHMLLAFADSIPRETQVTRAIERIDQIVTILTKAPDYYKTLAAMLLREIQNGWSTQTRKALEDLMKILAASKSKVSPELAQQIRDRMAQLLTEEMRATVAGQIGIVQERSYRGPFGEFKVRVDFGRVDRKALGWLHEDALYWIGEHYSTGLSERLSQELDAVVTIGMGREEAGNYLGERLGHMFDRTAGYWEGLSTHIVTRSREFGAVSCYQKAGAKRLKVVAVLDARTTPICRHMNGRIIDVDRAVKLRDKLIDAKEPDDVKAIAPWLTPDQAELTAGIPDSKLPAGLALPPYHFNCRTRTVIAREGEERKIT